MLVSDKLDQDKVSVFTFMDILLKDLKSKFVIIEEVHVFSDGAASHFKQHFLFSSLFLLEKTIWNFFATSHGKGVIDGIGGTVKRAIWGRILSEKVVIKTAVDFAEVASQISPSICIQYIPSSQIDAKFPMLEEWWQDVAMIPNT